MRLTFLLLLAALPLAAKTYQVGPGKQYKSTLDLPYLRFKDGDSIEIFWRPEPYKEQIFIGWSQATVKGIPGPNGERPVLDGDDAAGPDQPDTTPEGLDFWNRDRGLIRVSGSSRPADRFIRGVTIEGLEIRNARLGKHFYINRNPRQLAWVDNAAGIQIEKGSDIVIRNCKIHHNSAGIFVGSIRGTGVSRNVLIQGNEISDNGNPGSGQEHNTYIEASGVTYEHNRMFLSPNYGANIKDRSAGLIIRYNWIEGGNRCMDLVESQMLTSEANYQTTWVYGNVFIKHNDYTNDQLFHYGGDTGNTPQNWRHGVLLFYNNTVFTDRTSNVLFRLSDEQERVELTNNVIHVFPPPRYGLTLVSAPKASGNIGTAILRNNWITKGKCPDKAYPAFECTVPGDGKVIDAGGNIWGDDPLFRDMKNGDFRPAANSPLINKAAPVPELPAQFQWTAPGKPAVRKAATTIGAFEP